MPDKISTRLAHEIVSSGYTVVSEAEIREMEGAIRQREIMVMTTKRKKLVALSAAIENLIERIFRSSDIVMFTLFPAAIDLQKNIHDALDELDGELHLEKYPL